MPFDILSSMLDKGEVSRVVGTDIKFAYFRHRRGCLEDAWTKEREEDRRTLMFQNEYERGNRTQINLPESIRIHCDPPPIPFWYQQAHRGP